MFILLKNLFLKKDFQSSFDERLLATRNKKKKQKEKQIVKYRLKKQPLFEKKLRIIKRDLLRKASKSGGNRIVYAFDTIDTFEKDGMIKSLIQYSEVVGEDPFKLLCEFCDYVEKELDYAFIVKEKIKDDVFPTYFLTIERKNSNGKC